MTYLKRFYNSSHSHQDDKTNIENGILAISSTETNSALNITATLLNTEHTIEVISIDAPSKEVRNALIFKRDNSPRYAAMI